MKVSDFKKMSVSELNDELSKLLREQFNLRMQKANGQLTRFHLIKNAKLNVARVKTILKEKEIAGSDNE